MLRNSIKEGILENSFAISLIAAVLSWTTIVYGAVDITYIGQMGSILVVLYFACRLYQAYKRRIDSEYRLLGSKYAIEKLFICLAIIALAVATAMDFLTVARY